MYEYRKVQKVGNSTYTISLPKNWCNMYGINEGKNVYLEIDESGRLIINPSEKEEIPSEFNLYINKEEKSYILRKLISIYLSGYNTIKIIQKPYLDYDTRKTIEKFLLYTIGMEILEETKDMMILHDISNINEINIIKILRRIHHILENMLVDLINILKNYDENIAKNIIERDLYVDRSLWAISKQMYKILKNPVLSFEMNVNLKTVVNIRFLGKYMERIADHIGNITMFINLMENNDREKISKYLNVIKNNIDSIFYSFLNCDIEKANVIIENTISICNEIKSLYSKFKDLKNPQIILAYESVYRIGMYTIDFAETVMDECIDVNKK
ncbi:MAG: PhoU domain-containing protein [Thermoplasmata archaeon]